MFRYDSSVLILTSALSSVVERLHDTQKVGGPIPPGRTNDCREAVLCFTMIVSVVQ